MTSSLDRDIVLSTFPHLSLLSLAHLGQGNVPLPVVGAVVTDSLEALPLLLHLLLQLLPPADIQDDPPREKLNHLILTRV